METRHCASCLPFVICSQQQIHSSDTPYKFVAVRSRELLSKSGTQQRQEQEVSFLSSNPVRVGAPERKMEHLLPWQLPSSHNSDLTVKTCPAWPLVFCYFKDLFLKPHKKRNTICFKIRFLSVHLLWDAPQHILDPLPFFIIVSLKSSYESTFLRDH